MEAHELISAERIGDATALLAGDPTFGNRIEWWLRGAHASERWFQFEWAYRLQSLTPVEWSVVCERTFVDVVFVPAKDADGPPHAGVEIKWYGNWWVDDLSGIEKDIAKITNSDIPSAATLFFLEIEPTPGVPWLDWMPGATVSRGAHKPITSAIKENISRAPNASFEFPVSHESFVRGKLSCFVWRNDR